MTIRQRLATFRGDERLSELCERLVGETRTLASAELSVLRAKATERVGAFKTAAILFAVAGVLAFGAFIALLVGLEMTLGAVIGIGFATLIVVGVVLIVAAVLAMIGKGQLSARDGDAA